MKHGFHDTGLTHTSYCPWPHRAVAADPEPQWIHSIKANNGLQASGVGDFSV